MLRHAIAPARAFAQIPNAILRHPRLSSDAKSLLNWQLSLPPGDRQCLSATARRAGIGKTAFQKAKRQLLEESYLHEWRMQTGGGRFVTVQLISNTPLNAKEALAVRDGLRPAPGGAHLATDGRPGAAQPTAGEPAGRAVGRQPEENTEENTSPPTTPVTESADERRPEPEEEAKPDAPEPPDEAPFRLREAEAFLQTLGHLDPRLSLPRRTARRWAPLAAEWLEAGLTHEEIRHALSQGLADVRSPIGVLRWRLENALPDIPPLLPSAPRPQPRLTGMRECATRHTQPRLFTPPPGSDEDLCPDCRAAAAGTPDRPQTPPETPGYAAFRSARRTRRRSAPPTHPPHAKNTENR